MAIPVARALQSRRLALLFQQIPAGTGGSLLAAAGLVVVLWGSVSTVRLSVWAAAMGLVALMRLLLARRFAALGAATVAAPLWRRAFAAITILGGLQWGAAAWWLFPPGLAHQAFLVLVLGGVVAASLAYLAPAPMIFLGFMVAVLAPLSVRMSLGPGSFGLEFAWLIAVFAMAMALALKRVYRMGEEALEAHAALQVTAEALATANGQLSLEAAQRAEAEQAARAAELRARVLADAAFEGVAIHDDGVVVDANRTLLDLLGCSLAEVQGRSIVHFVAPEERAAIASEVTQRSGAPRETLALRADGSSFPVEFRARDLPSQGGGLRVVSIRDLSAFRLSETALRRIAHFDPLTGLPNRGLFEAELRRALAAAERGQRFIAVLSVNLDKFRDINHSLGPQVGDAIMRLVAQRIGAAVRGQDLVARSGGDEFWVLLDALDGTEDAVTITERLRAGVTEPYEVDGAEIYCSASTGIALFPLDGHQPELLLRNAGAAAQRVKEQGGGGYQFYTPDLNKQAQRRLALETSLRRAVDRGEFALHYQPKIDLSSGAVVGAEALIRWHHPEQGMVSPMEFIPLAERTGLIIPIGRWVLERACADMRAWRDQGLLSFPVAVNLSPRELAQKHLARDVVATLARHGLGAELLELEITESALAEDMERAAAILHELHEQGVLLSVDDFGTGYSSLNYLKRFPVSYLKVDRSFVRNVANGGSDAAITRSVAALARALGLGAVAEGVETAAELEFLVASGFTSAQGYLFAAPLPGRTFVEWLSFWQEAQIGRGPMAGNPLLPRLVGPLH